MLRPVICEEEAVFSHLSCRGSFDRFLSNVGHLELLHTALTDSNSFFCKAERLENSVYELPNDTLPIRIRLKIRRIPDILLLYHNKKDNWHYQHTMQGKCHLIKATSVIQNVVQS